MDGPPRLISRPALAACLALLGASALAAAPSPRGRPAAAPTPVSAPAPAPPAPSPTAEGGILPTDAHASRDAARLEMLARAKAWDEWLRLYQHLVEDRTLLLARGDHLLVGLREHCHEA